MKITLVRHGETEFNYQNVLQGRSNHQLNDTGRRQCQKLREKLKDINFSFCYMSPLIRTVETAFILVGDRVETFPANEHILVVAHGATIRALHHLLHHNNLRGNLLDVNIINCYCETVGVE